MRGLLRIALRRVGAVLRATRARALSALLLGAAGAAAAVAGAVWMTLTLLSEAQQALGGGLLGALGASVGALLIVTAMLRVRRWFAARQRVRRALAPDVETPRSAELRAWDQAQEENETRLRGDARQVARAGKRIFRRHPLAGVAVGVGTGFVASKLLPTRPRQLRRAGRVGLRLARAAGWSVFTKSILDAATTARTSTEQAAPDQTNGRVTNGDG